MPTYEYECSKCRKSFEAFQSMKDAAFTICPKEKCQQKKWGRGKVQRQLGTGAGLIFKGSGFYITDYRSEGYKAAAKNESGGSEAKAGGEAKPGGEGKAGGDAKPSDGKAGGAESKAAPGPAANKPEPKASSTDSVKSPKKTD